MGRRRGPHDAAGPPAPAAPPGGPIIVFGGASAPGMVTLGELFEQIHSHARDAHGMDEVPPEVVDAIEAVITEVYPDGGTANAPDSKNASSDSAYGASSSP